MPNTILEDPRKLVSSVSVVGPVSETSSLLKYDQRHSDRSNSYSSTYEVEINELQFTKSRVEHDSYYLSPSSHQHRHLGVISVSMMLVSKMFGSGIFATPAIIYRNVDGSPVLFFLCWLIATTVGYGGMRVFLELSTLIDKNGGLKTYLQFLYYKPKMMMNCIVSILTILFGFAVTNSIIFAKYSLALFSIENESVVNYLALLLILFGTIMYGSSVKHAIVLQNYIGILKFILLLIMTVSSLYVIMPSSITGVDYNDNLKFDKSFWEIDYENFSLTRFSSLVLKATFSMGGYQGIAIFTGEVVNPKKTLKLACPTSMLIIFGSFLIINLAYLSVITREEMMQSDELVGALLFTKIFGSSLGSKFLTLSVAFSCLGNVLVSIYGFGRVNQECFREGFLPFSRILAADWPKNAPLPGLLVSFFISFLILVFPPNEDMYDFIINLDSYPSNFFSLLIGLGIFIIRWKYSYITSSIRAPIWSTVVFCFFMVFLMVSPLIGSGGDKLYAYCGMTCLVGCIIYWFIYFKFLPWIFGYDLVESEIALDGGLTVKQWEKIYY